MLRHSLFMISDQQNFSILRYEILRTHKLDLNFLDSNAYGYRSADDMFQESMSVDAKMDREHQKLQDQIDQLMRISGNQTQQLKYLSLYQDSQNDLIRDITQQIQDLSHTVEFIY